MTKEDVIKAVDDYTETVKDRLVKDRYKFFGLFFSGAKAIPGLKWASGGDIKEAVDAKMAEVLGPKDERDVIVKKVIPGFSQKNHVRAGMHCWLDHRSKKRSREDIEHMETRARPQGTCAHEGRNRDKETERGLHFH